MSDDNDGEDGSPSMMITFEHEITMVRIVENIFLSSQIKIKAEVIPVDNASETDYEITFAKVRFWLENIASRSIVFEKDNLVARKMLISDEGKNLSGNILMLTPYDPTDENLAIIFQAKMSALGLNKIIFGTVELTSNNLSGLRFTFVGSSNDFLPTMSEWIGDYTYFEEPWWNRDDASTLDVIPFENSDLSIKPEWAYSLDFIGKTIRPDTTAILRHDFKPTVINGGKKDEHDE